MIRHDPVLAPTIAELLVRKPDSVIVDCTLGDGGHSKEFLSRLGGEGRVVGLDRDGQALEIARARLGADPRFSSHHTEFSRLAEVAATEGVDGFLFDFGVSSRQLDEDARGFTIRPGVALDLRMDQESPDDLREMLLGCDPDELARELSECADVPRSRSVARKLVEIARDRSLVSDDLEVALLSAFPRGMRDRPREMARLSMALRMLLNHELDEIRQALPSAWSRLADGGRIAVLTYHSVEDRLAKNLLRGLIGDEADAPRDIYGNRPAMCGSWVVRRQSPDPEEVSRNPRARSAQLRVVEKRRGAALLGVLAVLVLVALVGSVMVGCVWRQTRHVSLEKSIDSARQRERRLEDSLVRIQARVLAERQPAAVAPRAAALGYRRAERQFRLAEPDTSPSGGVR
ncbi:MAG TPA: 16S rRNA (cytosine(1402)-N(4))-methyltransferase RsmH [Fibrobacteria bacterium]|nr:16S rRNA (cytosine(1402)-N(4))-methyltransferase RsmH [Fibrobacteria bacterium]